MMQNTPSVMAITLALLVSGCTTQPPTKLSDLPTAKLLRPNTRNGSAEKIGLVLSGGGTKAASYAMGELGRWQMTKALELSKDQAEFNKVLADQTQHKISYDSDTN